MPTKSANDLRKQVGQLLILGFERTECDARLSRLLRDLRPGGVILFARNIADARQTHRLLKDCEATVGGPLFRCVDLEGGTVDRLREAIAPTPSAAEAAATGNRRLFRRHGRLLGEEARALGFNVDFAPVLDLRLPASQKVLGTRTASTEPARVVTYAREFLRGLNAAKVLGCGKHFPGLGAASLDSHFELPIIKKPWRRLWAEDLVPYRQLKNVPSFVMVAHAAFPAVTGNRTPASMSRKWIEDVLRKRIGYRGLIVSDDLEMGAAQAAGSIEDVAVAAVRAGADMFLVCRKEDLVRRAWEAVVHEAERDQRFALEVEQSAARVMARKRRARELRGLAPAPDRKKVEGLRRAVAGLWKQVHRELAL
ncbi:MAG TPA: beta-N-acetylhexosaminidase [Terriglobales bacterium]|nr:beta-N-acetylhexosaminidase [Terriglobales bacterium]